MGRPAIDFEMLITVHVVVGRIFSKEGGDNSGFSKSSQNTFPGEQQWWNFIFPIQN